MASIFKRKKRDSKHVYSLNDKGPSLQEAKQFYEADDIINIVNRTQVTVVGNVTSTRMVPSAKSYWYEVIIDDGSAKIDGWFFGRKEIKGIELGSLVLMRGLAQMDQGEMTIANPYYQIL